jgi:hypothetical protein
MHGRFERAERDGRVGLLKRFVIASELGEEDGEPLVRDRIVGVERDGLAERRFRPGEVAIAEEQTPPSAVCASASDGSSSSARSAADLAFALSPWSSPSPLPGDSCTEYASANPTCACANDASIASARVK